LQPDHIQLPWPPGTSLSAMDPNWLSQSTDALV